VDDTIIGLLAVPFCFVLAALQFVRLGRGR
jgi:hypothetical protein